MHKKMGLIGQLPTLVGASQTHAQIEKEGLAVTWGCEKFADYLIGIEFCIETEYKPLIPMFSTKMLDELPPRIQLFRMRLMRFSYRSDMSQEKNWLQQTPYLEPHSWKQRGNKENVWLTQRSL